MNGIVPEVLPGVAQLQENGVCQRLAGQGGTRSSEGDGNLVLVRDGQYASHLSLTVHFDHHPGVKPVEGSVCSIGKRPHGIRELTGPGYEGGYLLGECRVSAVLIALPVHVVVLIGLEVSIAL